MKAAPRGRSRTLHPSTPPQRAALVSTGSEVVTGRIPNTNAAWLSRALAGAGWETASQTAVGDDRRAIARAIRQAGRIAPLVIVTGGLGPTRDDLTREVVSRLSGRKLARSPRLLRRLLRWYGRRGIRLGRGTLRQADIPRGAVVFDNPTGSAAGFAVPGNGRKSWIVCLPGVPAEMRAMVEGGVLPWMRRRHGATKSVVLDRDLEVAGMPESAIDEMLGVLLDPGGNPAVGTLLREGGVAVTVRARAAHRAGARRLLSRAEREIRRRLGRAVFGIDGERLEDAVGRLLLRLRLTLAVAESCTGGRVSERITRVPGISAAFQEGIVCYSNDSKIRRLGVSPRLLERHGAVSAETAEAMAQGVARRAGARFGLSVTGIAGPGGGSRKKPVGLVWFGLWDGQKVRSWSRLFRGDRDGIRSRAAAAALNALRLKLLELSDVRG